MSKDTMMTPCALKVNGVRLHYVTWGQYSQAERAILLVHGLTNNHLIWSEIAPRFAERGWYLIAPDLRGRGWSETPTHGIGIPYHVNDLLALCDTLGLARVHFIGHSLGALIGYFFAAVHPQRVNKLVVVDAGGQASPHILDILSPVLGRLGQRYPSLDDYLQQIQQTSAPVHYWNAFWERYYRSDVEVQRNGTVLVRTSQATIEEEMAVNATINHDVLFAAISAPTLILRAGLGTYQPDWFVLSQEEAERVQGLIRNSSIEIIPDGNHYTLIFSETFLHTVQAFLLPRAVSVKTR